MTTPRRAFRTPGTRELVIAFALVEAGALLWLLTRTSPRRPAPAVTVAPPAATRPAAPRGDSTPRPATHARP